MRAIHADAVIERGTTWGLSFQVWVPSNTATPAAQLLPADRIVDHDVVQVVATVVVSGARVEVGLGQGLWSDPVLHLAATDLVQLAVQFIPDTVFAAYQYNDASGPSVVTIESEVLSDGTVTLTLDAADTAALPDGTGQWDVTVTNATGSLRVYEGTIAAVQTVTGQLLVNPLSRSQP